MSLESAMSPGKIIIRAWIIFACMACALSILGLSKIPMLCYFGLLTILGIVRSRDPEWGNKETQAWSLYAHYRPRATDAGRWVAAPIAEIDKSTVGKLLASRLQREPGLRALRYGTTEPNPASFDSLYDPELDG